MPKIYCQHCGTKTELTSDAQIYCPKCAALGQKTFKEGGKPAYGKFLAINTRVVKALKAKGIDPEVDIIFDEEDEPATIEAPKTELKAEEAKNYSDESCIGFVLNYIDSYAKDLGIKHWSHCTKNQLEVLVKNVYNSLRDIYNNE